MGDGLWPNSMRLDKILRNIEIYDNTAIFRKYELIYADGHYGKKYLEYVIEKNESGQKYYPIQFFWQQASNNYQISEDYLSDINIYDETFDYNFDLTTQYIPIDINDDMLQDYYLLTYDRNSPGHCTMRQYINSINGFIQSEVSPEVFSVFTNGDYHKVAVNCVGDLNADGKDDLIFINSYGIFVYNGGFGITGIPSQIIDNPGGNVTQAAIADFNGDGINDLAITSQRNDFLTHPPRIFIYYGSTTSLSSSADETIEVSNTIWDGNIMTQVCDFNGDGIADIFMHYDQDEVVNNDVICCFYTNSFSELGYVKVVAPTFEGIWRNRYQLHIADFNADYRSDILMIADVSIWDKDKNVSLYLSVGCSGSSGVYTVAIDNITYDDLLELNNSTILVTDINNDGRNDFIQYTNDLPAINKMFLINKDASVFNLQTQVMDINGIWDKSSFYPIDLDGNGIIDFINISEKIEPNGWFGAFQKYTCQINTQKMSTDYSDQIIAYRDGLGKETWWSYGLLAQLPSSHDYSNDFPYVPYKMNMPVVTNVNMTNGYNGQFITDYSYKKPIAHLQGKGFLGFLERTISDYYLGSTLSITSELSEFGILLDKRLIKKVGEDKISETILSYDKVATGAKSKFIFATQTLNYDYLLNTFNIIKMENCDQFGNFLKTTTNNGFINKSVEHSTIVEILEIQNITDNNNWQLGRIKKVQSKQKYLDKPLVIRTSSFTYYPNGRLESETIEPDNAKKTTKYYFYDASGNMSQTKLTGNGQVDRDSYQLYYPDNQNVWFEVNNLKHVVEYLDYNKSGQPQKLKDINGFTTNFEYDGFGRNYKKVNPSGIQEYTVYRWSKNDIDATTNSIYYIWQVSSGNLPIKTFYDFLNRKVREVSYGFNKEVIKIDYTYDERGNLSKVTDPFIEQSANCIYYKYDKYNRIEKEQYRTSSGEIIKEVTYSYNNSSITTKNFLGQETAVIKNSVGWIIETKEPGNKGVGIDYYSSGLRSKSWVNDGESFISGTDINYLYDIFGNCTDVVDISLGTRSFVYNAFGEKEQEIYDGKITKFYYDGLGRVGIIEEPENSSVIQTYFLYDSKPYGKGKLNKIIHPKETKEYFYNNMGLISKEVDYIENVPYETAIEYDLLERPKIITRPSGIKLQYQYSAGFLRSISNLVTGEEYWSGIEYNALGAIKKELIGKVYETTYNYDGKHDLNSIQTRHVQQSGWIQDMHYNWDLGKNLTYRNNKIHNTTENFYYDDNNRIDYYTSNKFGPISLTYTKVGSIDFKSNVGDYIYDSSNPYKLARINNSTINDVTEDISYTNFDKISNISLGSNQVDNVYGINHKKIKQTVDQNGQQNTTIYIGTNTEIVIENGTSTITEYIAGGSQALCAIIKINNNEHVTYYVLNDHLGSIQYILSDDKAFKEELSFDPWGNRRNPVTLNRNGEYYSSITNRGFTGHEHLDQFSLINMNGRVFDPVIACFTSADPNIQDPYTTTGLNRYIYCLNNPLSYTDPSGYFAQSALGMGMSIVPTAVAIIFPPATPVAAFVSSMVTTLSNGGSWYDSMESGSKSGAVAATSQFASNIIGDMALNPMQTASLHSLIGGISSYVQTGKFLPGAMSGFSGSLIGKISQPCNDGTRIIMGALGGGFSSSITGGKFINGATTGAFIVLFNDLAHELDMQAGGDLPSMRDNPPSHPDYKSPKGGDRKVRNPNGSGSGWIDDKGRVWVPTDHKGTHAPHWDREIPGGGHENVYPFINPTPWYVPSAETIRNTLMYGTITVGVGIIIFDIVTIPSGEGLIGVQMIRMATGN